jgi:antitoxin component YwqK of YwqJK toxin-antitoxin module
MRKQPLEGTVRIYDGNRNLEKVLHYENGRLQGQCEGYFPSGAVEWQNHYDNGLKNGIQRIYFQNGRMRSETPFINGHIHGIVTVYDEAGHLIMEIPVKNDKVSGEVLRYRYDDGASGYQAPTRTQRQTPSVKVAASTSDELDLEALRQLALARQAKIQAQTKSKTSPTVFDDKTVDDDSVAFSSPTKEQNNETVTASQGASSFWDDFGAITGKYTRTAASSPVTTIKNWFTGSDPYGDARTTTSPTPRYRVGVAVPETDTKLTSSLPLRTASGNAARDAANLLAGTTTPANEVRSTSPSNVRRATENTIIRDYLSGDINEGDPDALARERIIAQMEKRKAAQTIKTSASGMEVLYRQGPSGNEYLVYPKGGARDNESWKYQMLKNGYDYNDAIKQGLR